jgi:hypothetical protein
MSCAPCRIHDREAKYYANGEDAYEMRNYFGKTPPKAAKKGAGAAAAAAVEASA